MLREESRLVVSLYAGRDAVREYVQEQAAQGLEHIVARVTADNERVLSLIDGLSEEDAMVVPELDAWSAFQVMRHLASSLDRSYTRLASMSAGRPFNNPPTATGQISGREYASFDELMRTYREGMSQIIDVLRAAEPGRGLELTADHAMFGSFNWPQWAVYSHHVHTHDHIGQLDALRRLVSS
jgi:DinB superfamily